MSSPEEGDKTARSCSSSRIWVEHTPHVVAGREPCKWRRSTFPRLRSLRNLALMRRHKLLRPSMQELQICRVCHRWRRLGQNFPRRDGDDDDDWRSDEEHIEDVKPGFYCQPCWKSWRSSFKKWWVERCKWNWDYVFEGWRDEQSAHANGAGKRYEFVEIGTSHFDTFSQAIVDHPDGKPYAWNFLPWDKHPLDMLGLSVDMVQHYLDQLPDLPNVKKVCAAISSTESTSHCYHVPLSSVEYWEDVFARCGRWRAYKDIRLARGCSALGEHRVLKNVLKSSGLLHLAQRRPVQTMTIGRLLEEQHAGSIGVLALDCEGHDCDILHGLIKACERKPSLWPEWIWFESNAMNDDLFGEGMEERTVQMLLDRGYDLWWGGGYKKSGKRDTVLRSKAAGPARWRG